MRSKIAKKLLATSVLTAMTIGLVGCGEAADVENQPTQAPAKDDPKPTEAPAKPDDSKTDDPVVVDPVEDDEVSPYTVRTDANGNPYDLGGMEIIIRDWWTNPDNVQEPSNAYEEELAAFREWMQEEYNFTLVQKAISDWGSTPGDFIAYATIDADENNYLWVQRACGEMISAMRQGLMVDLAQIECLDFSEEKWSAGAHKLYDFDGKIYGMAAEGAEPRLCVYFNKDVLKDAGIDPESLYEIQENMQWNWDKFEEICAQVTRDLDSDGVNDIWGYTGQDSETWNGFVYSNGGEYIGFKDGKYVYRLEDQDTMDGLKKAFELKDKYYYLGDSDPETGAAPSWDAFLPTFAKGQTAFLIDQCYRGQEQLQTAMANNGGDFEWGVVCMPMGPAVTDYTNMYENNVITIPANYDADRAAKIAFAYDMWYEPVPGFEDYAGWKAGYQKNYCDTESVDLTLARLKVNGRSTGHGICPGVDMGAPFFWRFGEFNFDPAAIAEMIKPTWTAYIDEANK